MPGELQNTNVQSFGRRGASEYGGTPQKHEYQDVSGLRIVARAADGASPKVVRVHGDYGLRTVGFEATRAARPPLIPRSGDVVIGGVTTDVYLGGVINLPMPTPNEQHGGLNWSVEGVYTYLQTPRRQFGSTMLPTGGYPYRLYPIDTLISSVLQDTPVPAAPPGVAPTAHLIDAISAKIVDHNVLFTWPFTALPAECVVNGLIGG